jgi:hypothetical protein
MPQQNNPALVRATIACAVAQLAMVIAGHYVASVALMFAPLGMAISLVAGGLYALWANDSARGSAAMNGAIAGGVGALIGIIVSFALGDVTASILAIGTVSSAVTGALGGFLGSLVVARRVPANS